MTAAMASGAVQSFASAMSASGGGFSDFLGGITGVAGAAGSMIGNITAANRALKKAGPTAQRVGAKI